jgi:hypothetical protein
MADETSAAQGLAGLAVSASLMEALLKRGIIEQADADTIIRDASSYVAAFSTDCGPQVEREAQRLLTLIGKAEQEVAATEAPPIPVVDPAKS